MRIPSEKQSAQNPKLVNPWEGPYRDINTSENSALITLIGSNKEPVRVPFDTLRKLPPGVSNEPRRKKKLVENEDDPENIISKEVPQATELTLIGADHLLNLRRRCDCGLFGQMAHVALPGLKHPLARAKKVNDMFELANIASISEEECWGDTAKERELRMKNSQYLSPYGIALAMDAHRRRCPDYAEAIKIAKGQRFEHSAVFAWSVRYDLGAYMTTAVSMLDYVQVSGMPPNPNHRVFIALPQSFAKVNSEVDYDDAVITLYVYEEWSTPAKKLLETQLTPSIIIVWPDKMPESRAMRQLLIALEKHQQIGGSLMFFPSPFEDSNEEEWKAMADTCAKFVRYITYPSRNFEALVRDHYSEVKNSAPYTHPAGCLGTDPRFKKSPFNGRQIRLYLEKMRLTINDVIKMKEFDFASVELKERRRKEKLLKAKRRREEHMPNFYVIQDPERRHTETKLSGTVALTVQPVRENAVPKAIAVSLTIEMSNVRAVVKMINVTQAVLIMTHVHPAFAQMIHVFAAIVMMTKPSESARKTHAIESGRLSFPEEHCKRVLCEQNMFSLCKLFNASAAAIGTCTSDGRCVICDSYVRPCSLVRICDECNYGSYQGRCVICGGPGVSEAYYCKECTIMEKDRDGCPKIVNLGSAKTDLFYERKKFGHKKN
ncbi:PHF5-like protein [Ancylostoma ceylanicum]|uniref:PHF5-like protein n=1 Tax=Ancylostoma ceylanicum TaxID=53326 RepID=A0A0D6LZA7_9BILA|nr:PHF5-like protein [Ancylostoma ceylanicum]